MTSGVLKRQYILDSQGEPVGVILPIEEYRQLVQALPSTGIHIGGAEEAPPRSLYGVLRHLGGTIASTDELDETRRELWATWDRESEP